MKKRSILAAIFSILCVSNTKLPHGFYIPVVSEQIVQTHYTQFDKRPLPLNGDICIKWIKQLAFYNRDINYKIHYHPAQTTCYKRASQRRHF